LPREVHDALRIFASGRPEPSHAMLEQRRGKTSALRLIGSVEIRIGTTTEQPKLPKPPPVDNNRKRL